MWYQPFEEQFSLDDLQNFTYEVTNDINSDKTLFSFSLSIPNTIELASEKIGYGTKKLYEIAIGFHGSYKSVDYCNIQDEESEDDWQYLYRDEIRRPKAIVESIEKKFLKFAIDSLIPKNFVYKQCKNLKEIAFFRTYPHLRNYDFLEWKDIEFLPSDTNLSIESALEYIGCGRTEKSLKKVLFKNYKNKLKENEKYRFLYINLVCKYISDPNIALKMIELDFDEHLEYLHDKNFLEVFFVFLVQRYTYKQIAKFFLDYVNGYPYILNDSATMVNDIGDDIVHLPTIKANVHEIHNALVTLMHKVENNNLFQTVYDYPMEVLNRCVEIDEYIVKVPQDGLELYNWSNILKNCLSSYNKIIVSNTSIIYGFFKDDILEFAIELREDKIFQAKQKFNVNITQVQKVPLSEWYDSYVKPKEIKENNQQ
jgi:hypothetical protein